MMPQGAGLFTKLGGYVMGAGAGAAGRYGPIRGASAAAGYGMGSAMRSFAGTSTGVGMMGGTIGGGLYGAVSNDTSVLGGMVGGAAAGGLGGRYAPGINRAITRSSGAPMGRRLSRAMGALGGQMKRDALLMSNKATNLEEVCRLLIYGYRLKSM
jgi:hypothetical protein